MNSPDVYLGCLQQALALVSSGEPDEALQLLADIPRDSGFHPHALHLRGVAHATQGRTADAIASFEDALPWLADNDELLGNLARAYTASERFVEALALLDKLASGGKPSAITYSDRAVVLEKLEEDGLALDSYDIALTLDASLHPAWTGKANLLHKIGRYDEALACHDCLLAMQPDNALAISGRASTLDKLGRMLEALPEHRHAQAISPRQAAIWCGHGVCLVLLDRLEEGLHCFDQALEVDPSHLQAMINRASVLAELGRYPASLAQFDNALLRAPAGSKARAQTLCFQGMVRLTLGNPEGWAGHAHRTFAGQRLDKHNAMAPLWSGAEPLAGKRILLWGEQGYGDIIQFCRYVVPLAELGATVLLEVPRRLVSLCASLPAATFHEQDAAIPPHDFHIPMMSMPLALQNHPQVAAIPCAGGYLHAGPRFVEKWKDALPRLTRKPRIGLACSGALHHPRNARRSIPLEKLLTLTGLADLVMLQPELLPDDLAVAKASADLIRPALDIDDFSDVAGLIANLDLVLSVDTSIAHLAGALGVPVWVFLPWNAEWRWETDRADTPWYESARLFRQSSPNDWDAVIREVHRALTG